MHGQNHIKLNMTVYHCDKLAFLMAQTGLCQLFALPRLSVVPSVVSLCLYILAIFLPQTFLL